jgi:hypothetical protein
VTWPHPPRGTCVPGCGLFGQCHCGCGEATRVPRQSTVERSIVRGRPMVYRSGHNVRVQNRIGWHPTGPYGVRGVDRARLRPLVRWLLSRYGWDETSRLLGMSLGQLWKVSSGRGKATPASAARVVSVVRAHRRRGDVFTTFEVALPRFPSLQEQAIAERERVRKERRRYRDRHGRVDRPSRRDELELVGL